MRAALPLLILLSLPAAAWAQDPADALSPATRRIYVEGQRLEAQGRLGDAAIRYRSVLELDPAWRPAILDLGRVLEAQDKPKSAATTYQRAPHDPLAVEALGRLWIREGEWTKAAAQFERLASLRPEIPEPLIYQAWAVSGFDPLQAAQLFEQFLDRPGASLLSDHGPVAATAVATALQRAGEREASRLVVGLALEALVAAGAEPDGAECDGLRALLDEFAIEDEADRLMRAADRPLDRAQAAALAEARARMRDGDLAQARDQLSALVRAAPNSATAHGALADALLLMNEVGPADRHARIAEQLDPLDPNHAVRLGDLLYQRYPGRFDREAADAYSRALSRPNPPAELWFRRGEAELRAGLGAQAAASMRRYLALEPAGALALVAAQVAEAPVMVRPDAPVAASLPDRLPELGPDGERRYWIAQVLTRPPRGSPDELARALEELTPLLKADPGFVRGLNLAAEIHVARGELDQAVVSYRSSLTKDPEQGGTMVVLASLLDRRGESAEAAELLDSAAALGEPGALIRLASEDLARMRLWSAQDRLDRYYAAPALGSDELEARALSVQQAVTSRQRALYAVAGGALATALGVPVLFGLRRRGGVALDALIERAPAAWPEVARILSAIRHEVLKHHTTVLVAVADALEVGDPALGAWAADRLGGSDGAIARFHGYVEKLEILGRVHGVSLNLRHRDPVFGPLMATMDQLSRLQADIRAGNPKAAEPLREMAVQLNGVGYRALGTMLQRLCVLPLRADFLAAVWERVRRERQATTEIELILPDDPVRLRIYQGELDDILTNLLRNALEAASEGQSPKIGVRVSVDADDVTGLERVAIRVRDNAVRKISTAMIRGRYIGRGLGLAVDLISRNGGSIHVEPEPGWAKAIVVRLPSAEAPDLEDE